MSRAFSDVSYLTAQHQTDWKSSLDQFMSQMIKNYGIKEPNHFITVYRRLKNERKVSFPLLTLLVLSKSLKTGFGFRIQVAIAKGCLALGQEYDPWEGTAKNKMHPAATRTGQGRVNNIDGPD